MLRIGEFAQLSQTSTKMLRYYDEIGLLKPVSVDPDSGYRYYETSQLKQLQRILLFREMGFALEQIKYLLHENLTDEQIQMMLRQRRVELLAAIQQSEAQLYRVENWLQQFRQEDTKSAPAITLKSVSSCRVASLRVTLASEDEYLSVTGRLHDELERYLRACGVEAHGPASHLYHSPCSPHDVSDLEIAYPVPDVPASPHERIHVYELPAVATMASCVHIGDPHTLFHTRYLLMTWIEERGYRVVGPKREIHHCMSSSEHTTQMALTEMQYPVKKLQV